MTKQSLKEWQEEGKKKFGDLKNWAFKCPACGHVATVQDFLDAGGDINDSYQNCIGRINGKGENGMKGKDKGYGCNWAAYGLFGTLGKGRVITITTPEGKEVELAEVFDFSK